MKTYILRAPKSVEAQSPPPHPTPKPCREDPAVLALVDQTAGPILFIGLDVHKDSIAVSLAPSDGTEVRRYGVIGGTHDDVLKVVKKLQAAHPGTALRFCYEAGPTGFPLQRCLRAHGHTCLVVAPSKIPRNDPSAWLANQPLRKRSHDARNWKK